MEERPYRSFLRNYLLTEFFYDFIFAYAIYTVLFKLRGLSVFQIALLLWGWGIMALLFEIPTGALADSWSRRKMMALAPLIKALCFVAWFFAHGNFYLYLLGFGLWALGSSFVSGTTESLLYDGMVHFDRTDDYEKAIGRKGFLFHARPGYQRDQRGLSGQPQPRVARHSVGAPAAVLGLFRLAASRNPTHPRDA